ncbi:MAG: L-seryl-tRNA(Sec) selenium transferase [Anaerolineaceae bacterium]
MIDLRQLPSVDKLLNHPRMLLLTEQYGRAQVVAVIQQELAAVRANPQQYTQEDLGENLIVRTGGILEEQAGGSLVRVINASGVILHTNLGRAPLSHSAIEAMQQAAAGYTNLEFNLESGRRGSRSIHARDLLCRITGAEDALVVNNNAAAVLLALSTLAKRRAVVISRSQLVEIGGGFRVPDVMKQSGARLVEVGTTNRTKLKDYELALEAGAALVMRAHTSNFKLVGFTEQPELDELGDLAHRYGVPVLDDLGSGALLDTAAYGLSHEPMVQESLRAGVDLACFSGDKLLGGPQSGILVGRAELIAKLKRHPLARAIRADKLCLAGLSATLQHYLKGDAEHEIPVWRMISADAQLLRQRADSWQQRLGQGEVLYAQSTVGGGSLPEEMLPTFVLALHIPHIEQAAARLRKGSTPVIARVQDGKLLLDPRTVLLEEEDQLIEQLNLILAGDRE